MMPKNLLTVLVSSLLLAACATSSKPRATPQTPLLEPIPEFLARQDDLRASLQAGHPRELVEAEWERFDDLQVQFQTLLGGVDSVDALSDEDKLQLYNARRELVGILIGEGEEYICMDRAPPVGTRIAPKHQCIHKSRLEQEDYATETWRLLFEAEPRTVRW